MYDLFGNISESESITFKHGDSFSCECKTAVVKLPTEEEVKEQIKAAIQDYDNSRFFSDDILGELLEDKIKENLEKIKAELERKDKRDKKRNINNFILKIKKVEFNNPWTIVFWRGGDVTRVRCQAGEPYDAEKGLAMAIIKHLFGDISYYNEIFKVVFEEQTNLAEKNVSVKKKAPLPKPKKRKRLPSQEKTDFQW